MNFLILFIFYSIKVSFKIAFPSLENKYIFISFSLIMSRIWLVGMCLSRIFSVHNFRFSYQSSNIINAHAHG